MLQGDERLQFIHIPKTAGTSLISLLDARFPVDAICPAQLWRELLRLPQEDLPRYRLFRGHFGGGGVAAFLPEEPVYLTMLRDPITLALSTYKFIKREPGTRRHAVVVDGDLSFAEFIVHPETRGAVTNKLARNLSLDIDYRPGRGPIFPGGAPLRDVDAWIQRHRVERPDAERLEIAMGRLESCAWFGLVERFDESMALLAYRFGWPPVGKAQKLRVAGSKPGELDAEVVATLRRCNGNDLRLCEWATRAFDARLAAMFDDLRDYLTPQERMPARIADDPDLIDVLLDRHYRARRAPVEPRPRVRVDFDDPLPGTGWQRRETAPADGSTFRWTGPQTSAWLDLDLDRGVDQRLTVRLANAASPEIADSLELRVDGAAIDSTIIEGAGATCRTLQGLVPQRTEATAAPTRIELSVDRTACLRSTHPLNPDERDVGVAVNWIDARPASELPSGAAPEVDVDPKAAATYRRRRRLARSTDIKHRVARIPVLGPWLRQRHLSRGR